MDLIKIAEQAFDSGKEHPKFKSGDTITVVNKVGKVRRAKLYYLRERTGKSARIKEKRV